MSSCGEYSSSDKNNGDNQKVDEKKGDDTSEVGKGKSDTTNADLASSKSVPKASESKPSLIDDYADPNTEPFDPIDPGG